MGQVLIMDSLKLKWSSSCSLFSIDDRGYILHVLHDVCRFCYSDSFVVLRHRHIGY